MRSETITIDNVHITITSRTRRTAIIEAQYKQVLIEAHPEVIEYESAQRALIRINLPIDVYGRVLPNLNPQQQLLWDEYIKAKLTLSSAHPLAAQYYEEINGFLPIASRMSDIKGTIFDSVAGLTNEQVLIAFDTWLDEAELWKEVMKAIVRLDTPLTDVTSKPPENLTEAEQADPLSENPASNGSADLKSASMDLPSGGAGKRPKKMSRIRTTESLTH